MHLSYDDLEREVADAIAATDTAFGNPDVAREAIVWTECVLGRGFDLLRLAARQRAAATGADASITERQDIATVDLAGRPVYGLAARLTDLATNSPNADGFRTVEACGGFGGWVAPYIAFRLAREHHHAAVLWRPDRASGEGEAPATLVLAAAAQQQVSPILIAPGAAYGARERDKLLVGQIPRPLIDLLHKALGRHPERSLLAIVAVAAARDADLVDFVSIGDAVLSFDLASRAPELVDAEAKLRAALRSGVRVEAPIAASLSQRGKLE